MFYAFFGGFTGFLAVFQPAKPRATARNGNLRRRQNTSRFICGGKNLASDLLGKKSYEQLKLKKNTEKLIGKYRKRKKSFARTQEYRSFITNFLFKIKAYHFLKRFRIF